MTSSLRIACAQLNPVVGDLSGNAEQARAAWKEARAQSADLLVFPELFIAGYPPEDLVLKPAFVQACMETVHGLAKITEDGAPAMIVGTPWGEDGKVYNAVALLWAARSRRCATRSICRITAFSTRSGISPRARCRGR